MADLEKDIKVSIDVEGQKEIDKAGKSVEQLDQNVKNVEKSSKKTNKATKLLTNGFKLLGTALKAAGIGLVIGAVVKLGQVISQNQRVMDAFNTVMNGISIVFTELTTAVFNAFDATSQATGGFASLGKVIGGLLNLAITPLKLGFLGIKLAIQQAQLIWEESFFGDNDPETIKSLNKEIEGTKTQLKETAEEAVQSGKDVLENFVGAAMEVGTFGKQVVNQIGEISVKNSMALAEQLTEARKAARLAEIDLQGLIEKYDRQAEIQRQIRDDERLTIDERIEANNELGRVLEEQLEAQLQLANQRVRAAELEIKATGDNIENQARLREALKEVAAVEAQITGFQSEQRVNEASLQRERLENKKEIAQIGKDEQELARLEAEQELERQRELINRTISNEQEKFDAMAAAQQEYNNRINEIEEAQRQVELEQQQKRAEQERAIQQQMLDAQMAFEQAKFNAANAGLNLIGTLAGKSKAIAATLFAIEKGLAVAQVISNAAKAIAQATAAAAPSPLNPPFLGPGVPNPAFFATAKISAKSIAATKISAGASIATILAQAIEGVGGGGGAGGNIGGLGAGSGASAGGGGTAPSFNLVGQSGVNQIAQQLNQQQNPIQAFVVGSNVTSQQELDRNIVQTATLD